MVENQFTIRRKVFSLFGAKFHIYDATGKLLGFCKQKAFKLKEDIRIYTDESMRQERLRIKARAILDFGTAYDVFVPDRDGKLGALRRMGVKSLFRDQWAVLGSDDREIGQIREDNPVLALMRRFFGAGLLVPQKFVLEDLNHRESAEMRTHFNPFVHKMTVMIHPDCPIAPDLILAASILIAAIEKRQD